LFASGPRCGILLRDGQIIRPIPLSSFAPGFTEVAWLYAAAIAFGLSFFAVYGLIPAYITKTVNDKQATAVFAGANVCLGLGTAFGNLVSGYIPELSGSLQHVYFGIAGVAAAGAFLVLMLPQEGTVAPAS